MESRPLAHSTLAIPELLDQIVDFLSGSRVDLHSCALVSKSWVPCAQFHIFGKIILLPPNDMKLLCRLRKTLEVSPHLAHFIRRLSVSLNVDLLESVAGMMLPRLQELRVRCTFPQYHYFGDTKTRFLVQSLLRIPGIRRVDLCGSFTSMSVIHAYFDNCAHIQVLGLMNAHVEHPGLDSQDSKDLAEASNSDSPISALAVSKIQLSEFIFPAMECQALDAWIVGPHFPFGFHRLQRIHIAAERWRSFQSFLAPYLGSIEYLKLLEFCDHCGLDFSGLSKLKRLDVDLDQDWHLPDLLAVLGRLPPNNGLETMGLLRYSVSAEDETIFKDFDATITALDVMHSLHRVEIDIDVLRPGLDLATFMSYFPTLVSKDQLLVHVPFKPSPEIIDVSDSESED
ncbi:hypothetical protein MSAN_00347900 [Mycena sanguinolenta]|uniref:F-box domain-containing protein n=1 Tax=Mycena sanguinolenta TaxID=230812 RepID=A0A8H6ZE59_9AGAR|nr:hypothetical protein MSAN_00347900 [Mycena sanguinolenta]